MTEKFHTALGMEAEDTVAGDFVDAIDAEVVAAVGHSSGLRDYEWGGYEDDADGVWPFVVVRDGREFEVDIDVRVVELTPELKAKREADAAALLERLNKLAPLSASAKQERGEQS